MKSIIELIEQLDNRLDIEIDNNFIKFDKLILNNLSKEEIKYCQCIYNVEMYKDTIDSHIDITVFLKEEILKKYIFYKSIIKDERCKVPEKLTNELLTIVNDYIKTLSYNINDEDIKEYIFYEMILKLIIYIPNMIDDKIKDLDINFKEIIDNKKEPKHYVDAIALINYLNTGNYNFVGHATTNHIREQGTLFLEKVPSPQYKKIYILKSLTPLSKEEQNYFDKNINQEKVIEYSNYFQFYYDLYKINEEKVKIGESYINTNLQYILNTYLIFIGDKQGLNNNYNNFVQKTFYNEDFYLENFYRYKKELNNLNVENKCLIKIKTEIEYLINAIDIIQIKNNTVNISDKLIVIFKNLVHVSFVLENVYGIVLNNTLKEKIDIIQDSVGISLINNKIKKNENYNLEFLANKMKSQVSLLKERSKELDENKIKKEVLPLIKKVISYDSRFLNKSNIKKLLEIKFSCENEKELLTFYRTYEDEIVNSLECKKLKITKNLINQNNYKNYIIKLFFFNNLGEVVKDEIYIKKNNAKNMIFLLFFLIFNIKYFKENIFHLENLNTQKNIHTTLETGFKFQKEYPLLLVSYLMNIFLYPNYNFLTNENKIMLINYLYTSLFDSYVEVKKDIIDNMCEDIMYEYKSKNIYHASRYIDELSKYKIPMYQLILARLFYYTEDKNLKEAILKYICQINYSSIFIKNGD